MRRAVSVALLTLLIVGIVELTSKIEPVRGSGTIYIRANGSVEPSTVPIQRDGNLYTFTGDINDYDGIVVERNNIIVDGKNHLIDGGDREMTFGIALESRENVTIENMIIKHFGLGCIRLDSSSNNFILANYLASDNRYGEGIVIDGNNNTISGNTITNNGFGISLSGSSSSNMVCHNNFVNNTQQVDSFNTTNVWDYGYPFGGNYWSDYAGTDANDDSIGDTHYIIDSNNIDHYPLINPFSTISASAPMPLDSSNYDLIALTFGAITMVAVFLNAMALGMIRRLTHERRKNTSRVS